MIQSKINGLYKDHSKLIQFTSLKILGEFFVFLFPLIIAKFVLPEAYGTYSLGMMIIFFSTTLLLGSSITPFIISANKELKEEKSVSKSFTNQLIFLIISLSLIGLFFLLFSSYIIDFVHIDKMMLVFLYLAFVGISIKSILGNYFLGIDKKTEFTKVGIYYGIFLLILLFILGFELKNLFLNYFLSSILLLLVTLPKIKFSKVFPLKFDKEMFLEHWDFTKWQIFGLTAVYFINWGDSIIINYYLGVYDVGVYNLAYQVFKGIISFMYIVNTFYLPEISKNVKDKKFINKYLFRTRIQLFLLVVFGVLVGIVLVPFILNSFFDESYMQASSILQVLLIGVIFKFWSIFYNPLYNVLKRYKYLQIMNVFQIILNIGLGIWFVVSFGLLGVAWATTISYFARTFVDEVYFWKKVRKELVNKEKYNCGC
ncbi:MAG: polysaccharide biosynthesis C-terminal domain-containing protein [Candidatus Woesearchaeota archaeon]|nr:polysaccharide biosynthesis C-terminal domain-containing protein [Candidatus Woesearchaeota archaeon]